MAATTLIGPYRILNRSHLERRAKKTADPRYVFYVGLLRNASYDAYLAEMGTILIDVPGFKNSPVSGRTEILYCRRCGWIADGP